MSRIFQIVVAMCCVPLVIQLSGCAAAAVAGATAGADVIIDRRTTGTLIDDNLIEFKVMDRLRGAGDLWQASHVNATAFNGILLLSGETLDEDMKQRIGTLAAGIPKVRRVHNELALAAPSTLLARSSDTWLTGKVKTTLFSKNTLTAERVKVVSEKGVVYLMGIVTPTEADQATEITRRISGVQRVVRLFEITA